MNLAYYNKIHFEPYRKGNVPALEREVGREIRVVKESHCCQLREAGAYPTNPVKCRSRRK
jgi:hypothetical protein